MTVNWAILHLTVESLLQNLKPELTLTRSTYNLKGKPGGGGIFGKWKIINFPPFKGNLPLVRKNGRIMLSLNESVLRGSSITKQNRSFR